MNIPDEKVKQMEARLWANVEKTDTCWLCTLPGAGRNRDRPRVTWNDGGKQRYIYVYRLAYETCVGPIPDGLLVCHTCDTPRCVRPDHLFVGTNADNMRDMAAKGRAGMAGKKGHLAPNWKGGNHRVGGTGGGHGKLHSHIVMLIKHRYAQGDTSLSILGRQFGVSPSMVSLIVNGKRWAEVAA